jgi:hypothetical protein
MTLINNITSFLTYYTWGAVCVLLFFLFAIAQFYERKSGHRSYYAAFLVSIALFAIAAVRYAPLAPNITGDLWGDILRFFGGLILGVFGLLLLKYMMGGRP